MNSILEGSHTLSSEQMEMAQRLQRTEIALGDAMLQLCEVSDFLEGFLVPKLMYE